MQPSQIATVERAETKCVHDLTTAEMLALATARLWVAATVDSGDAAPDRRGGDWRGGLRAARLGAAAAAALEGLFGSLAGGALRAIAFHCPTCPRLSADERTYLRVLAFAQHGYGNAAYGLLQAWLSPAALRHALGYAGVFAASLVASGLLLPLRGDAAARFPRGFALLDNGLSLTH